jgi:hypothetical protein
VAQAAAGNREHLAVEELMTDWLIPLPGEILLGGEVRALRNAGHDRERTMPASAAITFGESPCSVRSSTSTLRAVVPLGAPGVMLDAMAPLRTTAPISTC